jgi:hypothetical protein
MGGNGGTGQGNPDRRISVRNPAVPSRLGLRTCHGRDEEGERVLIRCLMGAKTPGFPPVEGAGGVVESVLDLPYGLGCLTRFVVDVDAMTTESNSWDADDTMETILIYYYKTNITGIDLAVERRRDPFSGDLIVYCKEWPDSGPIDGVDHNIARVQEVDAGYRVGLLMDDDREPRTWVDLRDEDSVIATIDAEIARR